MDQSEYAFIKRKVLNLTGVDLDCYKSQQVQRRLTTYLARSGMSNWHEFFQAIQGNPVAVARFRDYLTINVSSFFRDEDKFAYLQHTILPELLASAPRLRLWSAGCSYGHEPYSLAILLAEATGFYRRHEILATDIDVSALARAQAGGPYSTAELSKVPPSWQERYFRARPDGYYVVEALRRNITFRVHNLLADPFERGFDLIVCRNVVIYFTQEVKERLYRQFHEALRPGGILFVGGTEVISQAPALGFETVGISFYRRIDSR
ncbi:MAG: protein-glutamate O-methyltransferase CheR [Anaerolineae bacterium]|nr:protein-glutamate O-methyltransferase CheR [Anaerolineae bacterium]